MKKYHRQISLGVSLGALLVATAALAADLPSSKSPPETAVADPWSGFYVGGHMGYAWGNANWSGAGASGSFGLAQHVDTFNESGSFLGGFQAGYNYVLPNRVLLGVEADATFPAYPDLQGMSTGGVSNVNSTTFGAGVYGETLQSMGTLRGRIGYTPGNWLIYATGGLAWARNQAILTQNDSGIADSQLLWRMGWAAGAGVEIPFMAKWTAKLEYLYTDFAAKNVYLPNNAQTFRSDFAMQSIRFGVNYHFGGEEAEPEKEGLLNSDRFNFHGQATFVDQVYGPIIAPGDGPNSLPRSGQGRETFDGTLYAGMRLWQGAELWANPEIDQGYGLGNTHGAAAFPSGESYKLGYSFPYARVQRYFIRQEFDLGGEKQKVDADINQFAGEQTADRLVVTVGKFGIVDIFDTNKYSNNPKTDFLNWASINTGTFDYAGDAWGYTYGGAAEWYKDRFTLRGGVFDLSAVPAGGALNGPAYGLDPNFSQYQLVGELEERHELWGQAGKFKLTGYLSRGRMGEFQTAVNEFNATGIDASLALALDRQYRTKPGASVNIEQGVTDTIGVFFRAGYADGQVEPWDFADIDRTVQAGVSISGKQWGRPDDTWGMLGIVNGLDSVHAAYFAAGGLGILIGDGSLPRYSPEKVLETYYSYALTSSVKLTANYQFLADPGYNATRGPANIFAGRVHWQF